MTKLYKLSAPGWTKEFDNDSELKAELYAHICNSCREGMTAETEDGPWLVWEPVNENSSVYDMLATACGCEFDIGEDEDRETHYEASTNEENR